MQIINPKDDRLTPMKVIDMSTISGEKAYTSRPPEDTHSVAELDAVHRAIRFTQAYKQGESLERMNEEEGIVRPVPKLRP